MATSVFDMPKLPEREQFRRLAVRAGKSLALATTTKTREPAPPAAPSFGSWNASPRRFHYWTLLTVAALHIGGFAAAVSYNYYTAPQVSPEDSFVRVLPMDAPPPPKEQQLVPVFSDVPLPVVTPPALTITQPVIVSTRTSPVPPAIVATPAPVAPPAPIASAPIADGGAAAAAPVTSNTLTQSIVDGAPPVYPLESRRRKEQGTVVLFVKVGKNGHVVDVTVRTSSGHRRLDLAAVGAVRKWRWQPFLRGGTPVEVSGSVEIPFILSGKAT